MKRKPKSRPIDWSVIESCDVAGEAGEVTCRIEMHQNDGFPFLRIAFDGLMTDGREPLAITVRGSQAEAAARALVAAAEQLAAAIR